MKIKRRHIVAATIGLAAMGAITPVALASPGAAVSTTVLVTSRLDHRVHLNADRIKFQTKVATDVRVQSLTFAVGGQTGWHHHPGIVLVAVQSGSVTVWDSHCEAKTYGPGLANGAVFTESGDEPGLVTSAGGALVYATLIAPKADPPVFRLEDAARSCPQTGAAHDTSGDIHDGGSDDS